MESIENIKAIGKKIWPQASTFDVLPCVTGHTPFSGADPQRFRFVATSAAGQIIWRFEAKSLADLETEMQRQLKMKEQQS